MRVASLWSNGLFALALALCGVAPAAAQAPAPGSGGLDGMLETFHLKAKVPPAPDFVSQTRPKNPDFIPVGTPHPARPIAVMTPAEVAAQTAELDALRARQQQRAGQRPGVVPLKPAKAPPPAKITVR